MNVGKLNKTCSYLVPTIQAGYNLTIFDDINSFFYGSPRKNIPFCISLIFGKCPRGMEWHTLVLKSRGSVEFNLSRKYHVYADFRFCKRKRKKKKKTLFEQLTIKVLTRRKCSCFLTVVEVILKTSSNSNNQKNV